MIPYSVYKVMHLVGLVMLFLSIGGLATHMINGGTQSHQWRKALAITHGVGLLFLLVAGFGLLARLGIVHDGLPLWAYAKLAIWILFAFVTLLLHKKAKWAKFIWILSILLAALAAYLAGSKPF